MLHTIKTLTQKIWFADDANSATEYAIMLALIIIFGMGAVLSTGDVQRLLWIDTASKVESIVPP